MKHHFADTLDRSGNYWTITPNNERWRDHHDDLVNIPADTFRLTITKNDLHWQHARDLEKLTELTLHEPSQDQLAALADFPKLTALRISHARPATLAMLANQTELQELVLEYVSRVTDLSPVGALPKLTALHLENLRGVSDFSGLGTAHKLRCLSIYGTLDWSAPVQSFDFLADLHDLEDLHFGWGVRAPDVPRPLASLLDLKKLRHLGIHRSMFPLETFAWLEVHLPHVEGTAVPICRRFGGEQRKISKGDYRSAAKMSLEEFTQLAQKYKHLSIGADGTRYEFVAYQADFLGKGARAAYGTKEEVEAKCQVYEEKYRGLLEACRGGRPNIAFNPDK
jgi:hypothetical protein